MFIPLGLNAKPAYFAWMSVLIVIATSVYSLTQFDVLEHDGLQFIQREDFQRALQLRADLSTSFCKSHQITEVECRLLYTFAKSPDLFETQSLKNLFVSRMTEIAAKRNQKNETQNIMKMSQFFDWLDSATGQEVAQAAETPRTIARLKEFSNLRAQLLNEHIAFLKSHNYLSKLTLGWKSVLKANGLHAGWMHLAGNMFFFFVFAVFVEARLGWLISLFVYVVGGSIGMYVQSAFFLDPSIQLLGASGCVSATLGAAFALFWRERVKFLFSLVIYNRTFLVHAWVAFPIIFLAQDITGALKQTSNVGHIAHLVGFACGFAFAKFFQMLDPIPKEFLSLREYRYFLRFDRSEVIKEKIYGLRKCLELHPENPTAFNSGLAWILEQLFLPTLKTKEQLAFFSQVICDFMPYKLRTETPDVVVEFVCVLPPNLNFGLILRHVPLPIKLKIQDEWIKQKIYSLSIQENLRLEKLSQIKVAREQWEKIITSLDLEITHLTEEERNEVIRIVDMQRQLQPNHEFLNRLGQQVTLLKERSYVNAA